MSAIPSLSRIVGRRPLSAAKHRDGEPAPPRHDNDPRAGRRLPAGRACCPCPPLPFRPVADSPPHAATSPRQCPRAALAATTGEGTPCRPTRWWERKRQGLTRRTSCCPRRQGRGVLGV